MNYQLLAGARVVESSAFIAAPLAGLTLAQFGADVIRIDLPGGGIDYGRLPMAPAGRSIYWTSLNKGKRSFVVDFRRPEGKELVRELVTRGDPKSNDGGVLLTNLGASWLSHASLATQRPDLISCTIEGNNDGTTAVDYTVNCAVGFPLMTGSAGGTGGPINHVLAAWDVACAYQAAFGIAAALSRRQALGKGAELRLALSDVAFSVLNHLGFSTEVEVLNQERTPIGNYLYGAFGKDFLSLDGHRLYVVAISLNQWKGLVKACGIDSAIDSLEARTGFDFRREGDRYEAREEIAATLEPWFSARPLGEIRAALDTAGVCWGPYQSVRQALNFDPRLSSSNPIFDRVQTSGVGEHLAAGTSFRLAGESRGPTKPAPALGEHTEGILFDVLGLDSAAVGRLHDAGIVALPQASTVRSQS